MKKRAPTFQGPLQISADGRHFVDGKKKPFFWLGDTAWPFFSTYAPEEAEMFLRDRKSRGFTVVQCVIAWIKPEISMGALPVTKEDRLPMPNHAGIRPWSESPAELNEAYFESVDRLVAFAAKLGIVLAMLPTWGGFVIEIQSFTPELALNYGRWLGQRYKACDNIVWVSGGDRVPKASGNDVCPPESFEAVYRALGEGLKEGCGKRHLITYHPCGTVRSDQFFHNETWLDFNMIETWASWMRIYPMVTASTARTPRKPIVLGEGAYENGPEYPTGPITPLIVRRQAWWAFMAGGFFTYGQDQMWRMAPNWTETFGTPGAQDMSHLAAILGRRPWWRLYPDQSLFESGVSFGQTLNTAMVSDDESWALAYLSSQCHVRLHLDRLDSPRVKATWINPHTGLESDGGIHKARYYSAKGFLEAYVVNFSTPGHWEDALLLLESIP